MGKDLDKNNEKEIIGVEGDLKMNKNFEFNQKVRISRVSSGSIFSQPHLEGVEATIVGVSSLLPEFFVYIVLLPEPIQFLGRKVQAISIPEGCLDAIL